MQKEIVFTFKGTQAAILAEQLLKEQAVEVRVMPLPAQLGDACGICLRVFTQAFEKSLAILQENNIPMGDIFEKAETDNHTMEYKKCTL